MWLALVGSLSAAKTERDREFCTNSHPKKSLAVKARKVGRVASCVPLGGGKTCERPTTLAAGSRLPRPTLGLRRLGRYRLAVCLRCLFRRKYLILRVLMVFRPGFNAFKMFLQPFDGSFNGVKMELKRLELPANAVKVGLKRLELGLNALKLGLKRF